MLDWKILAASFAALLFVSSMLVGDFGVRDFFSTVVEKLGEWLGNSPFGGLFTAPTSIMNVDTINLKLYPDLFVLKPDSSVNISFDKKEVVNFVGEITVDYNNKKIILDEINSPLNIVIPIETTRISGLKLKKLLVKDIKIDVSAGEWEISNDNGSIEIYDFSGLGEIDVNRIQLEGNITRLIRL